MRLSTVSTCLSDAGKDSDVAVEEEPGSKNIQKVETNGQAGQVLLREITEKISPGFIWIAENRPPPIHTP